MKNEKPASGETNLRPAGPGDKQLVFSWRNDPEIIVLGTSRRSVTWEEHSGWFDKVLDQTRHLLFIIETMDGTPAGTVRLDRLAEDNAEIAIYLLNPFTGKGLGTRAIQIASARAFEHWPPLTRIEALVRTENQRSLKAFSRAGFHSDGEKPEGLDGHVLFLLDRSPDTQENLSQTGAGPVGSTANAERPS
jgi:RimJ/RimL family protein N-acetyltransferase